MASRRLLQTGVTADAISTENIRFVPGLSRVRLYATAVTVTDEIGLFLDRTEILAPGTANVSAAATGMVDTARDQLVFDTVVGAGQLRVPVPTCTTSVIFILVVEPIL